MTHLTRDQLSALVDGALQGRARADAERHLESCASCRDTLAELAATDVALRMALEHDPGEAYFAAFPERVARRLGEERRGRGVPLAGWRAWFTPPRMAWAASAAALAVAAGVVFMQGREGSRPMERSDLATRAQQQEAAPAPAAESGPARDAAPPMATMAAPEATPTPVMQDAAPEAGSMLAREGKSEPRAQESMGDVVKESAKSPHSKSGFARAPAAPSLQSAPAPASDAFRADERATAMGQRAERPGAEDVSQDAPMAKSSRESQVGATAPSASDDKARAAGGATKRRASEGSASGIMNELRQLKSRIARPLERDSGRVGGAAPGLAARPRGTANDARWRGGSDEDDAWPAAARPYVQAADSLDRLAGERESADAYDTAADTWATARSFVTPGSRADIEVRVREADSRWAAYSLRATMPRTRAAHAAVDRALEALGDDPRAGRYRGYRERLR